MKFFGTDGIRGVVTQNFMANLGTLPTPDTLTFNTCFACANALAQIKPHAKVLIGHDTRLSSPAVMLATALGLVLGGADVTSVGVCTTPGISHLTRAHGYDYGIAITASHNPAPYNGIKIFDKSGKKLSSAQEKKLEKLFSAPPFQPFSKLGNFYSNPTLVKSYEKFLSASITRPLSGLKVVLDTANGAAYKIAPKVFKECGAEVVVMGASPSGHNINHKCGATNPKALQKKVVSENAHIGFAFDGDADRLIAVTSNGKVLTGDNILYAFARTALARGHLTPPAVVGTQMSSLGLERALKQNGITLLRGPVGDKHLQNIIQNNHLQLGAEPSGHVIVSTKSQTGDGILNALVLSQICLAQGANFTSFCTFKHFPQVTLNVPVQNKISILSSHALKALLTRLKRSIKGQGRLLVRASGTENVIRIMAETQSKPLSTRLAKTIQTQIKNLNQ